MKFTFLPFFLATFFLVGCGNEKSSSSQSASLELPSLIPEIDVVGSMLKSLSLKFNQGSS